jgi:2,4-dienoyl-CoA reductase-like NADH-dependent reductase (Old Yellow Enzyme family)
LFPRIAQFKTAANFRERLAEPSLDLPCDDEPLSAVQGSPLAQAASFGGLRVGNRFCIHPMEGWDGLPDGAPSELTLRRWRHFGTSGAKLIWGGEAAAVEPAGRANPNQLLASPDRVAGLAQLLDALRAAHRQSFEDDGDLVVGLQLTHSGRFSRPHSKKLEPRLAYQHPLLNARFGLPPADPALVCTDDEIERLIDRFVEAAGAASRAGFQFVDIKACHGYLLHEFLSAYDRPGKFGCDFDGRTRLLRTIVGRVLQEIPGLLVGVRLSAFDSPPFVPADPVGRPMPYDHLLPYRCAFGVDPLEPRTPLLDEAIRLVRVLAREGVAAVNVSAGSPYYCPHVQRPATFPPSDGYQPPEDPLVGVARQIEVARAIKQEAPETLIVGTGYSYLQEFAPHVAQGVVRRGWVDCVGLGRMALSYPELPADLLAGRPLVRKRLCRTFSDCTTAPRLGLESGCFPLDPFYKALPQAAELRRAKEAAKNARVDSP